MKQNGSKRITDSKHLVLLVGTNPLPNYVAAKYFLSREEPFGHIWLVHSAKNNAIKQNGTEKQAETIKEALEQWLRDNGRAGSVAFRYISLEDVSSSRVIEENIKTKLLGCSGEESKLNGNIAPVNLNYTGGTKAMAVHVYRTMEKELGDRCTFSYLDAREYKIKIDGSDRALTDDLRKEIDLTVDDLLLLHNYAKKEQSSSYDWEDAVNEIQKIIEDGKIDLFLDWVKSFLVQYYYKNNKFHKKSSDFREQIKEKNGEIKSFQSKACAFDKSVLSLLEKIPDEYSLLEKQDDSYILWVPDEKTSKKKFGKRLGPSVRNFLHGKWLEYYVYKVLQKNLHNFFIEDKGKIQLEISKEMFRKNVSEKIQKPFEIDLILMHGYYLCGISCTTSAEEDTCKLKGFEVLHRVNQFGGDEARAVLITGLKEKNGITEAEKVAKMEEDLRVVTGSQVNKIKVLGRSDWKENILWEKVRLFVWGE